MVLRAIFLMLMPVLLAGCVSSTTPAVTSDRGPVVATSGIEELGKIDALTAAIATLGPEVSPEEAARVARISVEYPLFTLAPAYQITDPPLIHNIKVNTGRRPRGLCRHWADDMEARLKQENLTTLSLHRAIANHDNHRIEHSTVIVSALGAPMEQGIVLDPWRQGGGELFWTPVLGDPKYKWVRRQEVFAYKLAKRAAEGG